MEPAEADCFHSVCSSDSRRASSSEQYATQGIRILSSSYERWQARDRQPVYTCVRRVSLPNRRLPHLVSPSQYEIPLNDTGGMSPASYENANDSVFFPLVIYFVESPFTLSPNTCHSTDFGEECKAARHAIRRTAGWFRTFRAAALREGQLMVSSWL